MNKFLSVYDLYQDQMKDVRQMLFISICEQTHAVNYL